jgi:hypothetical protein
MLLATLHHKQIECSFTTKEKFAAVVLFKGQILSFGLYQQKQKPKERQSREIVQATAAPFVAG